MHGKWLVGVLILAALLPAGLLLCSADFPARFMTPDSYDYDSLAQHLLADGAFSRTGQPELFRTPLYPAFLAGVYAVAGHNILAALAVQTALNVLLCLLVFKLGAKLASPAVGLAAAAVQAISPVAIVASTRLLSEGLFALLLTGALLLLVGWLMQAKPWRVPVAGVLMGLACLVRPMGWPMALATVVILLIFRLGQWRWVLAFAAALLVTVVPWLVRNRVVANYDQIAGVGDFNLFYCNALTMAELEGVPLTPAQGRLADLRSTKGWPQAGRLNDPAFLRLCRQEGLALMAAHPAEYAKAHLATMGNVFLPAATDMLEVLGLTTGNRGTLAVLQQHGLTAAVRHYFGGRLWPLWLCLPVVLVTLATYIAAVFGGWRSLRRKADSAVPAAVKVLLWATFLYYVLTPGPVALPRFAVPIAPLLSLAAGIGIVHLRKNAPAA